MMVGKVVVKVRLVSLIIIFVLSQLNLCLWFEVLFIVGRVNLEDRRNDEVSKRLDLGVFCKLLVYVVIFIVMIVQLEF